MSKRFRIALVVLLATVLAVSIWRFLQPRQSEPVYLGKTLSQWVVQTPYDIDPSISSPAVVAVRQMGTNAVPFLVEDLRSKDGLLWRNFPQSLYRFWLIRRIRFACGTPSWERRREATFYLEALGPLATPAIPALSDCLDQPDLARPAAEVLGYYDSIGRVGLGPEVTLTLLKAMTNGNNDVRRIAANALGLLKTKPDLVVPALVHALKDPAPQVRGMAARSFGGYKTEAATIIPALLPGLDDTDPYVRQGTVWMLGRFRARASPAVPKLLVLLNDSDLQVRTSATNALQLIDPEVASKAGLRIIPPPAPPDSP